MCNIYDERYHRQFIKTLKDNPEKYKSMKIPQKIRIEPKLRI